VNKKGAVQKDVRIHEGA